MKGSSVSYQQELDQHIKNQYHEICFNPNKRHILQRLISSPREPIEQSLTEQRENDVIVNNRMLKEYMNSIYDHYGIEDPIKRQFRLAKKSLDLPNGFSPEKSLNATMVTESDRLTNTKKKLISLKNSFKRDSLDIVFSSQLINQESTRECSSPFNRSKMSREIGYRTKEKMHFKKQPRQSRIVQGCKPIVKHQFVIENQGQPKTVIKFNSNSQDKPQMVSKEEVPVVFRYCPMCEQPVLDCNITHHQDRCKDIQRAYQLSYVEIEKIILQKIKRLEVEIQREFLHKDQRAVTREFGHLKESVKHWMDGRQSHSLEKVKFQFQNFACGAYEKINKLNWFKRLYKTVVKRQSLEQAFK